MSPPLLLPPDLPASCRVNQRVPKKLLLEHGAVTAADKRQINEGLEELQWLAALKPTTIGVPPYQDQTREYLELAVLQLVWRAGAKAARLVELVHRAIPYPVFLLTQLAGQPAQVSLSLAHKRWSQGEAGQVVLEGELVQIDWSSAADLVRWADFPAALALSRQPQGSLYSLYQGWVDTLLALQAARLTGSFTVAATPQQAASRATILAECLRLEGEMVRLRVAAQQQTQIAQQVALNLQLQQLRAEWMRETARLAAPPETTR